MSTSLLMFINTLSYVFTNTLGGIIGGAISIRPITVIVDRSIVIREYFLGPPSKLEDDNIFSMTMLIISILGPIAGIIGGIMANNYIYSMLNGVLYSSLTTVIITISGSLISLLYNFYSG